MPALFSPRATPIGRSVLIGLVTLLVAAPIAAMAWVRTPWARGTTITVRQPVAFDHVLHTGALRIDCRFCHSGADRTAMAGLPPTDRCTTCHTNLWLTTGAFAQVRASLSHDTPIHWQRVTQLPGFVYFNHAVHTTRGVGCETCHGRVDRMPVVQQAKSLRMSWCLDCHRNPAPWLRPQSAITTMGWIDTLSSDNRRTMLAAYNVKHYTNCSTCHR